MYTPIRTHAQHLGQYLLDALTSWQPHVITLYEEASEKYSEGSYKEAYNLYDQITLVLQTGSPRASVRISLMKLFAQIERADARTCSREPKSLAELRNDLKELSQNIKSIEEELDDLSCSIKDSQQGVYGDIKNELEAIKGNRTAYKKHLYFSCANHLINTKKPLHEEENKNPSNRLKISLTFYEFCFEHAPDDKMKLALLLRMYKCQLDFIQNSKKPTSELLEKYNTFNEKYKAKRNVLTNAEGHSQFDKTALYGVMADIYDLLGIQTKHKNCAHKFTAYLEELTEDERAQLVKKSTNNLNEAGPSSSQLDARPRETSQPPQPDILEALAQTEKEGTKNMQSSIGEPHPQLLEPVKSSKLTRKRNREEEKEEERPAPNLREPHPRSSFFSTHPFLPDLASTQSGNSPTRD